MTLNAGNFALALRAAGPWALFPVRRPQPDGFGLALRGAEGRPAVVGACAPEAGKFAVSVRSASGRPALAGLPSEEDDPKPLPVPEPCPVVRNPLCNYIPCGPSIYRNYTLVFSGFGGALAGVNGRRQVSWDSDCLWQVEETPFIYYLSYPTASGAHSWMVYAYRLSDNAVFSNGTPGSGPFEAEAVPMAPVYLDGQFGARPEDHGMVVAIPSA